MTVGNTAAERDAEAHRAIAAGANYSEVLNIEMGQPELNTRRGEWIERRPDKVLARLRALARVATDKEDAAALAYAVEVIAGEIGYLRSNDWPSKVSAP